MLLKIVDEACYFAYIWKIKRKHSKTHYFKVKFLVKKSIFNKAYSRVVFFGAIFLVKSKLSTAKKSKTTTFSRVLHPPKNRQFSREIEVEFLDKK